MLVGGQSAVLTDLLESLGALLPWMALMVVATTFVLLFLAFGSVVLPVKALVMNVLSLGASFGALVWIFQDGHLSGFLNFTPTGFVEATQPILVLAIIFGLSMDYEVFLMSRIREQYDLTGDNTDGGRDRAAADRRDHHQRGAAAARGDRRVLAVGDHVHQDDRRRDADRRRGRRDDRPDPAGAGDDAAARATPTGTRPDRCAGSTRATGSGSPTASRRRRAGDRELAAAR